jgi:hypothetical protein
MTADTAQTETVGQFKMAIAFAEPSSESTARWGRRADFLAALLVALWQDEHPAATKAQEGARP